MLQKEERVRQQRAVDEVLKVRLHALCMGCALILLIAASQTCSFKSHACMHACVVCAIEPFLAGMVGVCSALTVWEELLKAGVHCRLQRASVVCTTLTGVLMRDLRDVHFDVAIIDEAAQVPLFPDASPTPSSSAVHHTGLLNTLGSFCQGACVTGKCLQVRAWVR